jgi:hypothetical protein
MSGTFAKMAKVVRRPHQPLAKEIMPHAIDINAGSQRIPLVHDTQSQFQPAAGRRARFVGPASRPTLHRTQKPWTAARRGLAQLGV